MKAEIIKYLGIILSKELNLGISASAGLIRLAIKDQVGPFKPLEKLNFKDYKTSCENALKIRLEKLHLDNVEQIIAHTIK